MGEGAIDVTRRVADVVPEFGANGKDEITIEQVMLHTSGFPRAPFAAARLGRPRSPARALRRAGGATGSRERASSTTPRRAHWVLAELIERVIGSDFRDFMRTRVIEPLGLPVLQLGVPPARAGRHQRARAHAVRRPRPTSSKPCSGFVSCR